MVRYMNVLLFNY